MLLDGKPLAGSILAILSSLDAEIHSAPLSKLIELHNRIFSTKLLHRIGADLNHDLLALADLRNLFAHGRIWRLDIPGDPSGSGTLDGNPVKGAALRLHAANIISDLAFNGRTHGDFTQRFYSDEALLYFYDKAKLIEAALFSTMDFEAEKFWLKSETPLPDLEPIPSADPTAVT